MIPNTQANIKRNKTKEKAKGNTGDTLSCLGLGVAITEEMDSAVVIVVEVPYRERKNTIPYRS